MTLAEIRTEFEHIDGAVPIATAQERDQYISRLQVLRQAAQVLPDEDADMLIAEIEDLLAELTRGIEQQLM